MKRITFCLACLSVFAARAQQTDSWNHKSCAVVLTYDDAIDVDLDNVVPALDSLGLRATFYIIGSSTVIADRMPEWRKVAGKGHELGNHSMFHPCDGSLPGRGFVSADNDLSKYSVRRAVAEIRQTNVLLTAIDGKTRRTFAYPCGDMKIHDTLFYNWLQKDFVAARGVQGRFDSLGKVNLDNVDCFAMNGQTGAQMIDLVRHAMQTQTLLVFLFHGVGGGHSLNVSLQAHSELIHFLHDHEKEIWIAPMVEVADYIRANR